MKLRKHNWVGWSLGAILVLAIVAIFWMLIAQNVELQHRTQRAEEAVKELVVQNRGPQGPDGTQGEPGRAPTPGEIASAVEAYCDAHAQCAGPTGAPGKNGTPGAQGSPGVAGATGQSITKVVCERTSISFWAGATKIGSVSMVCIP